MRLNEEERNRLFELVKQGFGSRKIAKMLNNKISFQAVAIHVRKIKNGIEKESIESKLDRIIKLLEKLYVLYIKSSYVIKKKEDR